MRVRRLSVLVLFLGMVWLVRADQPAYDEVEINRLQLEKWKKDAPHYSRLRRNLGEFLQLPPNRQETMRQLDRDLQEEDSATSGRLFRVLERYTDWLNQLPEEDRQTIVKSSSDTERLQHIKQIRDREWILRQPKNVQDELKHLQPAEQATRITQLRKREAEFRRQWELAIVFGDQATRMRNLGEKLSDDVRFFIKESLEPMLSVSEKKELIENKDKWPLFEMKLVELADKHPVKLPGQSHGIKSYDELPEAVKKAYPNLKRAQGPAAAEGHWPEYAEAVTLFARNRNKGELPVQLGICRPADFSEPVRQFIEKELKPVLKPAEKAILQKDEGFWPAYPRTLHRFARAHSLAIPGMALPGPRDLWESFRHKSPAKHELLPEVADKTLLDFSNNELTAEERASWPSMLLKDPQAREEWKRAYFMRHPDVLKQLKRQETRKEHTTK
jgi:hypothetical protein